MNEQFSLFQIYPFYWDILPINQNPTQKWAISCSPSSHKYFLWAKIGVVQTNYRQLGLVLSWRLQYLQCFSVSASLHTNDWASYCSSITQQWAFISMCFGGCSLEQKLEIFATWHSSLNCVYMWTPMKHTSLVSEPGNQLHLTTSFACTYLFADGKKCQRT